MAGKFRALYLRRRHMREDIGVWIEFEQLLNDLLATTPGDEPVVDDRYFHFYYNSDPG